MTEAEAIFYIQYKYARMEEEQRGKYVTAPAIPLREKGRYQHLDAGLSEEERREIFNKPLMDFNDNAMAECCFYTEGVRQWMQRI